MCSCGGRRTLARSPGSAAVSPAKRSLCCVPGGNALDDCVRLLPALYRSFAVGFLLFRDSVVGPRPSHSWLIVESYQRTCIKPVWALFLHVASHWAWAAAIPCNVVWRKERISPPTKRRRRPGSTCKFTR
jgi:hypothetical protein